MLIMHGDKDPIVPLQQSELLRDAYKAAGADCKLEIYPGMGHGGPRFYDEAALKFMVGFLESHTAGK